MMNPIRRVAAALTLACLLMHPAVAQNHVAPTPPTTDNSNRIATTQWVNNFFAAGIPLASGKIWIGSAGNLATPQTPSGDCTLSVSGVITCTQSAGSFTVNGSLSVTGGELLTNIAAPSTPATGKTQVYVDATNKVLSAKNDAGAVSITVVPSTAAAHQWFNSLSAAGALGGAQPTFGDISGTLGSGQFGPLTGDVATAGYAATIQPGAVGNSKLAAGGANTVKGSTNGTSEADLSVPSCSTSNSGLNYTNGTGFGCDANLANLTVADQTVSGGANVTSQSQTTGNITIDCGARPLQFITNNGAFTITAPANDGSCLLLITNGATAGAVTFSGFSVGTNTGDTLTTTNTNKFTLSIWRINGVSGYRVAAHQ